MTTPTDRQPPTTARVHIRWFIRRDLPTVVAIERDSFVAGVWGEAEFLAAMQQNGVIGMVAECGEEVVGYMIYELRAHKTRLLNFAVAPAFRRRGVGSQMVRKITSKLSGWRRSRVTLAVREGNLAGQMFFRSCGFVATKVKRGYYTDSGEDAYIFRYELLATQEAAVVADGGVRQEGESPR